jgi:hypothetical protein
MPPDRTLEVIGRNVELVGKVPHGRHSTTRRRQPLGHAFELAFGLMELEHHVIIGMVGI